MGGQQSSQEKLHDNAQKKTITVGKNYVANFKNSSQICKLIISCSNLVIAAVLRIIPVREEVINYS